MIKLHNILIKNENSKINKKVQTTALLSVIILICINIIRIYDFIINPHNEGLSLVSTLSILILFIIIYLLARSHKTKLSAWMLITTYALPTIFCFYFWGADLPAALLMSILITIIASIFLGAQEALIISSFFSLNIIVLTYLQEHQLINLSNNWRQEANQLADAVSYVLISSVILLLIWLTGKENHKSLKLLQEHKIALQLEKEKLEQKVAQRTKEILNMKKEKIEQLQALASIGKLSGGIFHDIINPLTVVNLNLEQMKVETCSVLPTTQGYISQALKASKRIQELIESANNCLRGSQHNNNFCINKEIFQITKIMEAKARNKNTNIIFQSTDKIYINGNRTRFGQVIMNLISNAIDASYEVNKENQITITLTFDDIKKNALIKVKDNGKGIAPENINKIFQTFFSTKLESNHNSGLGLSVSKNIIEKEFNGNIGVISKINQGSLFTIILPLTHASN